jgi:hypothetical protein
MSLLSYLRCFFQFPMFAKNALSISSNATTWLWYESLGPLPAILGFSGLDSGVQQLIGLDVIAMTVRA